jgi:purine-cytosine permease-like protein
MNFFIKSLLAFVLIIIFLFIIGYFFGKRCYEIDSCKACWNLDNEVSHYNAIVDVISCACMKAKSENYQNSTLNTLIETAYKGITEKVLNAQEICEKEILIKYEI